MPTLSLQSICLISYILLCMACTKQEETLEPTDELDIIEQLRMIEGTTVSEIETQDHFSRLFEILFLQPVDHNQPAGRQFAQKIYLGHVGEKAVTVLETEGYARRGHRTRELAPLLKANQVTVEHRYFGQSVPQPRDWQYLDIWQAANDHHRIVEAFKTIYNSGWISSGVSKGGDAAIFHRRFFPDDVNATLAFVAPLLLEKRDRRFLDFYNQAGNTNCREKLRQYQRNLLMKLDSIPPLFEAYVKEIADGNDNPVFSFSLPYRHIVYYATREDYLFEFWSSETETCLTIPDSNATAQELFDHFRNVFDVFLFFSDYGVEFWTPYVYQAMTELGNYAYDDSYLSDLEEELPALVSFNTTVEFDASTMPDIQNWITSEAKQIVFIYGGEDPWTVAAVEHPGSDVVLKIVHPGSKHDTRLATLNDSNRDLVLSKINLWLSL